jgi:hypothetical protein
MKRGASDAGKKAAALRDMQRTINVGIEIVLMMQLHMCNGSCRMPCSLSPHSVASTMKKKKAEEFAK